MTRNRNWVQDLVMHVQNDFLETPALHLTLNEAQQRFGASRRDCDAVFGLLLESGVLARDSRGTYFRFFPHQTAEAA